MQKTLSVDLNFASSSQVGAAGLSRADFEAQLPQVTKAHSALTDAHRSGQLEFMGLPKKADALTATKALATQLARDFDDLLVLGIGGSSLGAKALFTSLSHPQHNLLPKERRKGMRVFFPDNSDAATFSGLLEVVDLKRTAIAAITKSGGTAETWAQLLLLCERVGLDAAKKQVVAITDPKKGALRAVAKEQGWATLDVPPAVGGRFSVLTPVGLLPAAAAGIDLDQLLAGAGAMAERCSSPELFKNPAYLLATALHLFDTRKARPMHVLMPYADALRETGDWFVQLWAESLGKQNKGPTPLRAVGATDQHSLLQLLMQGPLDKVVLFIAIDNPKVDLKIPAGFSSQPDVGYLGGHSFHGLLSAEQRATQAALAAAGRPSITLRLPALNAFSVGELLMLWEVATGFAGSLYGVDPYDQPGVEAGKRYACGILGRPGYEDAKRELEQRPAPSQEWMLGD